MNFTLFQKESIENDLTIHESIVFSLLKTFKNVMSFDEIIHGLPIIKNYFISSALIVLEKKDLIETSVVDGVIYYKIKR